MNEKEISWNSQLQSFRNPMQNLFGMMQNCVSNMGVEKYEVVYNQLEEARKLMYNAINNAQRIAYELPPIEG